MRDRRSTESASNFAATGAYTGGSRFQTAGLVRRLPSNEDLGRAPIRNNDLDTLFLKVPSPRNVEQIAPCFHDEEPTLDGAVDVMARHLLGEELADGDAKFIVAFLKSIAGQLPAQRTETSTVPESGPEIPKPVKG